jgi:hypothetical protein
MFWISDSTGKRESPVDGLEIVAPQSPATSSAVHFVAEPSEVQKTRENSRFLPD